MNSTNIEANLRIKFLEQVESWQSELLFQSSEALMDVQSHAILALKHMNNSDKDIFHHHYATFNQCSGKLDTLESVIEVLKKYVYSEKQDLGLFNP